MNIYFISFFFGNDGLEDSFDGNPYKCIMFFLEVETLVLMTAFPSGLFRCSLQSVSLSMEIIVQELKALCKH